MENIKVQCVYLLFTLYNENRIKKKMAHQHLLYPISIKEIKLWKTKIGLKCVFSCPSTRCQTLTTSIWNTFQLVQRCHYFELAPVHDVSTINKELFQFGVVEVNRSAQSPDLNPIQPSGQTGSPTISWIGVIYQNLGKNSPKGIAAVPLMFNNYIHNHTIYRIIRYEWHACLL